jgi:L-threonylcarbamoyladenylate synthase
MAMVSEFEACIRAGGVAVFPADTVYGLACDPADQAAVDRLYELKGRKPDKPSGVMFFDLAALPPMGPRTSAAAHRLLPGGVTLLIPNPGHRYPIACGPDPDTLGIRVPAGSPLAGAQVAVLQSSANHAGGPDPRTVGDIPPDIRDGVQLVLDAGPLPGTPSTVIDLRAYERDGTWGILREGAVPESFVADRLRC